MVRCVLTILCLSTILLACQEDKTPSFPEYDAPVSDAQSDEEDSQQSEDDVDTSTDCRSHDECPNDGVCFENECYDPDDVNWDCTDDDDCPEDWVCVDEDYCEED